MVFYHAAVPVDMMFFISRIHTEQRPIFTIVDRIMKSIPNGRNFLEFSNCIPGDFKVCEDILLKGGFLIVAPGGVFEALNSDSNYTILWKDRIGFSKLILKTNAKVLPVFTKNSRAAWMILKRFSSLWKFFHKITGIPVSLIYGGLPVKLTAIVGNPINISDCNSAMEVRDKVHKELEGLIHRNQRKPGRILSALIERFV